MRKVMNLFFVGVVALGLTGCYASIGHVAQSPVTGLIYADHTGPITATNNNVGSKVGTSEAKSILGLFAFGDAGINTAARNAGISKISHVDYNSFNILGIFAKYEVVVYGE